MSSNESDGVIRCPDDRVSLESPFTLGAGSADNKQDALTPAKGQLNDSAKLTEPTSISLYDTLSFETEQSRQEALKGCGILDTVNESRFDVITELVAKLFDVPVALVSLMDYDRDWFRSSYGPFAACSKREGSFCSYITVPDHAEVLIVADVSKDARFSKNLFVTGPPGIRYYAGAPLVTSTGHRLGTLCIVDFKPHYFPATAYNVLCNFAEVVAREVEKASVEKYLTGERKSALKESDNFKSSFRVPAADEPIVMLNVSKRGWPIKYMNEACKNCVGASSREQMKGQKFWDLFRPASSGLKLQTLREQADNGEYVTVRAILNDKEGEVQEKIVFEFHFWLASQGQFHNSAPVGIPGFVPDESSADPTPNLPLHALWIGTAKIIGGQTTKKSVPKAYNLRSRLFGGSISTMDLPPKFEGVILGPLIGKGSYGKVYRGSIGEKVVSVKVIEIPGHVPQLNVNNGQSSARSISNGDSGDIALKKAVLEAVLSRHLAHPNIVPTLDYAISKEVRGNFLCSNFVIGILWQNK